MASVSTRHKWNGDCPHPTCSCENNAGGAIENPVSPEDDAVGMQRGSRLPRPPASPRLWRGAPPTEYSRPQESCKITCCETRRKARQAWDLSRRRAAKNPCTQEATPDSCVGPSCNARAKFMEDPSDGEERTCPGANRPSTCPARPTKAPLRRCPALRKPIPIKCLEAPEPERPWSGTPTRKPPIRKPPAKDVAGAKPIKTSARPSTIGSVRGSLAPPSKYKGGAGGFPVRPSVGDQKPTGPLLATKISQRPKPDVGDGIRRRKTSPSPSRKRVPLKPVPKPVFSKTSSARGRRSGDASKQKVLVSHFAKSQLDNLEESDANEEELLVEVLLEPKSDLQMDSSHDEPDQTRSPDGVTRDISEVDDRLKDDGGYDGEPSNLSRSSIPTVKEVPISFGLKGVHSEVGDVTDVSDHFKSEDEKDVGEPIQLESGDKDFYYDGSGSGEEPGPTVQPFGDSYQRSILSEQPGETRTKAGSETPLKRLSETVSKSDIPSEKFGDDLGLLSAQEEQCDDSCQPFENVQSCPDVCVPPLPVETCPDVCLPVVSLNPCAKVCETSTAVEVPGDGARLKDAFGDVCEQSIQQGTKPEGDFSENEMKTQVFSKASPTKKRSSMEPPEKMKQASKVSDFKRSSSMNKRAEPTRATKGKESFMDGGKESQKSEHVEPLKRKVESSRTGESQTSESRRESQSHGTYSVKAELPRKRVSRIDSKPQRKSSTQRRDESPSRSSSRDKSKSPSRSESREKSRSPSRSVSREISRSQQISVSRDVSKLPPRSSREKSRFLPRSSREIPRSPRSSREVSRASSRSASREQPKLSPTSSREVSRSPDIYASREKPKGPPRSSREVSRSPEKSTSPEKFMKRRISESPKTSGSPKISALPKKLDAPQKIESPKRSESPRIPESPKRTESPKSPEPSKKSEVIKKSEPLKMSEALNETEPSKKSEGIKNIEPLKTSEALKGIEPSKKSEGVKSLRKSEVSKRSNIQDKSKSSKIEKEERIYEPDPPKLLPDDGCHFCVKCDSEKELKNENLEMFSFGTEQIEEFMVEVPMGGDSFTPEKVVSVSSPVIAASYKTEVSVPDLELLWKAPSEYLDISVNVSVSGGNVVVGGKEGTRKVREGSVDTAETRAATVDGDEDDHHSTEPTICSVDENCETTPSENMRVTDESLRRIMGSPTSIASTTRGSFKTARDDVTFPGESMKGFVVGKPRISTKRLSFAPLPKRSPHANEALCRPLEGSGFTIDTSQQSTFECGEVAEMSSENENGPVFDNTEFNVDISAQSHPPKETKRVSVKSSVRFSEDPVSHEINIDIETSSDVPYVVPDPSLATPSDVTENTPSIDSRVCRKDVYLQKRTNPSVERDNADRAVLPYSSSPVTLRRECSGILTSLPDIPYCYYSNETPDQNVTHRSTTDLDSEALSVDRQRSHESPLPDGIIQSPCCSPARRVSDKVEYLLDSTRLETDNDGLLERAIPTEQVVGKPTSHGSSAFIKDFLNVEVTRRATAKEEELTSESLGHFSELKVSRDTVPVGSDSSSVGQVTVVEKGDAAAMNNIPDVLVSTCPGGVVENVGDESGSSVEFDPTFLQSREHDIDSLPLPSREFGNTKLFDEVSDVIDRLTLIDENVVRAQKFRQSRVPEEVREIIDQLTTMDNGADEYISKSLIGIPEEVNSNETENILLPEKLLVQESTEHIHDVGVPREGGDIPRTIAEKPEEPSETPIDSQYPCLPCGPCACPAASADKRRDRKRKRPCLCFEKKEPPPPDDPPAATETQKMTDSEILFEVRVVNPPKGFEDEKEGDDQKPTSQAPTVKRKVVATKITKNAGDDRKVTRRSYCLCPKDTPDAKNGKGTTPLNKSIRVALKSNPSDVSNGSVRRVDVPSRSTVVPKKKAPAKKSRVPCYCKEDSTSVTAAAFESKPCQDVERTTLFMIKRRELIPIASLPPEVDLAQKAAALERKDGVHYVCDDGSIVFQEDGVGRNVDNESSGVDEVLNTTTTKTHKSKCHSCPRHGDRSPGLLASIVNHGQKLKECGSHASDELPWEDAVDTFSANLESIANEKLREKIRRFIVSRFEESCRHAPEEITLGIHYYAEDSEEAATMSKKSARESSSQVLSQIMEVERELESDSQEAEESDESKRRYALQLLERCLVSGGAKGKPPESSHPPKLGSRETKKVSGEESKRKVVEANPSLLVKEEKRSHERIRIDNSNTREGNELSNALEVRCNTAPGFEAGGDKKEAPPRRSRQGQVEKENLALKKSRVCEARVRSPSPRNLVRRSPTKKLDSPSKSTYSTESRSFNDTTRSKVKETLSPSLASAKTTHTQSSGDSNRKERVTPDPHEKLSLSFSNEDVKQRMSLRKDAKTKESAQKASLLSEDCVWEDAVESLSKSDMITKTSKDPDVFVPLSPIVVANDIVEFVTRFTSDQVRQGLSISKIFSRLKDKMEQRKTADVAVFASRQSLVARTLSDAQTQTEPMVSKTVKILVEKSSEVSVRVREVSVDKLGRRKQSTELTASMGRGGGGGGGREIAYTASNTARTTTTTTTTTKKTSTHVEGKRVSSQKLTVGEQQRNVGAREDVVIRMVPARGNQKDTIEIWRHDGFCGDTMGGMEVEVSHVSYDPIRTRAAAPVTGTGAEDEKEIAWECSLEGGEAGFEMEESKIRQQTICVEQQMTVNDSFSQTPMGDGVSFPQSGDGGRSIRTQIHAASVDPEKSDQDETTTTTLDVGSDQCIQLEQSNIQQQTICLQQQKIQITSSVIQQQKIHTSRSPVRMKKNESGEYRPGARRSFKEQVSTVKLINLPSDICGCPTQHHQQHHHRTRSGMRVFEDMPIVILHENSGSSSLPFNRSIPGDMGFQADDSLKHVQATTALRRSSNTLQDHCKQKRKFSSWDAMLAEAERRLSETEEKRRTGEISHEQAAKEFSNVARALRRSARKGLRHGDDHSKKKLSLDEMRSTKRRLGG